MFIMITKQFEAQTFEPGNDCVEKLKLQWNMKPTLFISRVCVCVCVCV